MGKYCNAAIAIDYMCGDTYTKIMERHGIKSSETVHRCIKKYGVVKGIPGETKEAVILYENGMSLNEIAEKIGCSRKTVSQRLERAGVRAKRQRCYVDHEIIMKLNVLGLDNEHIAKALDISESSVRKSLNKSGIFSSHNDDVHNEAIERLSRRLKEQGNGIEYVSGYIKRGSVITYRCLSCGHEFIRVSSKSKDKYKCPECEKTRSEYERTKRKSKDKEHDVVTSTCKECGNEFTYDRLGKRKHYCSEKCRKRACGRASSNRRRERIKTAGTYSMADIFDKCNGVCKICGLPVDKDDFKRNKDGYFIAGPNYPSVDHIIPVSKGGTSDISNLQLAHFKCNAIKGDDIYVM